LALPFRQLLILWRGRDRKVRLAVLVTGLVIVVALIATVLTAPSIFTGRGWLPRDADTHCKDAPFSCGVVTGVFFTGLAVAVAFASFIVWRVRKVAGGYVRTAVRDPTELIETAAPMEVVGRDELCDVVEQNLCVERRPQVIVGGVGAGKTAVIVRLTQKLAKAGAVPIPIQLRENGSETLDFRSLAKERFVSEIESNALGPDEAERIWRALKEDGLIVILIDGLEQALLGAEDPIARKTEIRLAIDRARQTRVPIVFASRPDPILEDLDTAVIRLEPLPVKAAVEHIRAGAKGVDEAGLRALAETAEIVEMPFYLRLLRDLREEGELDGLDGERLGVRVALLRRWTNKVVDKASLEDLGLRSSDELQRARVTLSYMACAALVDDNLDLSFNDFSRFEDEVRRSPLHPKIAAACGAELDFVELIDGGVRFRHSIVQAYLGAEGLGRLLRGDGDERILRALDDPGRELLMALIMFSVNSESDDERRMVRSQLLRALSARRSADVSRHKPVGEVRKKAETTLDLLGAAYEVDSLLGHEAASELAELTEDIWPGDDSSSTQAMPALEETGLDAAKARVVARLGEAGSVEAYETLWQIALKEPSHRLRLEMAQTIADGGEAAYEALRETIERLSLRAEEELFAPGREDVYHGRVRDLGLIGWILPTLAASGSEEQSREVCGMLARWIALTGRLHLGVESCLAQGFKFEANRLPARTVAPEVRARLIALAAQFLDEGHARWWYSRIALVHSFALWSQKTDRQRRQELKSLVRPWTRKGVPPLLAEAARLSMRAINRNDPVPYVWIDEAGTAAKIGPRPRSANTASSTGLWITPAIGWHSLGRRAQRLLGDLFLLLNLVERDSRDEREQRRLRSCTVDHDLPACLRGPVPEGRGLFGDCQAGEDSACSGACQYGLCPYPPKRTRPFRGELSEAFCRRQRTLLSPLVIRRPPWQRPERPWQLGRRRGQIRYRRELWRDLERRGSI
jgi:hypothetical protein